jgi:uncharacterized protein (TIGR03435 family)
MRRGLFLIACAALSTTLLAQTLSFEVASVKPNNTPPTGPTAFGRPSPGRFNLTYISLRQLIGIAYGMRDEQLIGVPSWAQSTHYDINAKAPADAPLQLSQPGEPTPMALMLRSLLADRFQLKAHPEKRELQVYLLVLARPDKKLGPKLVPEETDCATIVAQRRSQPPQPPQRFGDVPVCGMQSGLGRLVGRSIALAPAFIGMLQGQTGRLVLNRTGLTGTFDIDLTWTPERIPPRPAGAPAEGPYQIGPFTIDPDGPPLLTALQEQLGLKLESAKESTDVLVVDTVSQLTPD